MLGGGILFPVEKRFLVSFRLRHSHVMLRSLVEKGSVHVILSPGRATFKLKCLSVGRT